jgi:DNA-binding transcriptional LysR family regulator
MTILQQAAIAILAIAVLGCEAPNPNANTSTSGQLILYVDEMYAPLIKALADTFMVRSPNAKIEIRSVPARMAVQGLLDMQARKIPITDTTASVAAIIGRKLLPDEHDLITAAELNEKEYVIGYDGIAAVVPLSSSLKETTLERLRQAISSPTPTVSMLDSTAGGEPLRFILPDQYSSTFQVVRSTLLKNANPAAPARYYSTGDSVLNAVAAGEGIALTGWYVAHRDSARLRALKMGYTDSGNVVHFPVAVHPSSLVMGLYPLKQPLVGYTFSLTSSLAVGFLAWMSRSQDAQYFLTYRNFQPENVKLRLVVPDSGSTE